MRGRKPLLPNVIPMRPDGAPAGVARDKEIKREAKRKARKLMPRGLNDRLQAEWMYWAPILAHPRLDRLHEHYCYGILELCKTVVLIDTIDEELEKAALAAKTSVAGVRIYRNTGGRNGDLLKSHPYVAQREARERALWHWCGEFGLTPAADIRLENLLLRQDGQGELFNGGQTTENDPRKNASKYIR